MSGNLSLYLYELELEQQLYLSSVLVITKKKHLQCGQYFGVLAVNQRLCHFSSNGYPFNCFPPMSNFYYTAIRIHTSYHKLFITCGLV